MEPLIKCILMAVLTNLIDELGGDIALAVEKLTVCVQEIIKEAAETLSKKVDENVQ